MGRITFSDLRCNAPFLVALEARGFTSPTQVQQECFEPGMEGRDLLVQSSTGSGKTLAFGLPLMHRLSGSLCPQAIILTPTRELAQQVASELRSINPRLEMAQLVGGMSYTPQLKALSEGAKVVVGTPGRVIDHIERGTLDLSHIHMAVLDECDEMLNMGFIEDVERILSDVPEIPQTYFFSATLPAPVASLAKRFLKNPHHVELTKGGGSAQHADINHTACLVPEHLHARALVNLLLHDEPSSALIFTKMKQQTEEVAEALRNAGLAADYMHGDLNQGARNRIFGSFKTGRLRYLVATDVAARGLDIGGLPLVVNMGIPTQLENYIHRTGRTGRAGAKGTSLSLVGHRESRILGAWVRRGGLNLEWRAVPTPNEILRERSGRLITKIQSHEAPAFEMLAKTLLKTRSAEGIVAALLSLIEDEAHLGFDVPETPLPKKTRIENLHISSRHSEGKRTQRRTLEKRKHGQSESNRKARANNSTSTSTDGKNTRFSRDKSVKRTVSHNKYQPPKGKPKKGKR